MTAFKYWKSADELFSSIRNIFCVGRNYRDHATELGNDVPSQPMIFAKPTHALQRAHGTIEVPVGRDNIHHELEIVLFIDKPLDRSRPTESVGAVALGLDLTDRTAQNQLKEDRHPWEYAKGFIGSAVVSDFYRFETFDQVLKVDFELSVNGRVVQAGNPRDMLFSFEDLMLYVHEHFGLEPGDILYTGTPAGVGALMEGDSVALQLDGVECGVATVIKRDRVEGGGKH